MPGKNRPRFSPDYLLAGSPSSFQTENLPILLRDGNLSALSTGVMLSVALPLEVGQTVTNLTFVSGGTAAGTPTAWWFALYSDAATPALLAQTADQATAAWAANTAKTLALATAYTVPRTGVYYASVMVAATTPPTLMGHSMGAAANAGSILSSKVLAQTSGTGLTTTAPATIASPTTVANVPYVAAT